MIEILFYVLSSLALCRFFTWLWLYEAPFAQWEDSSGNGNPIPATVGHEPRLMKDGSILFDGKTHLRSDSSSFPSQTMYVLQKHIPIKNLIGHYKLNK